MDEEGMTAAQAEIALEDDIDAFAAKPVNGWTNWKEILFKNGSHQKLRNQCPGEEQEKTKFYTSLAYAKARRNHCTIRLRAHDR
ncbi:hypothetical protein NXY34_23525, partial [Bacteroides fragilis]|nr:hypothetical protein [Bacteroides fragilis]